MKKPLHELAAAAAGVEPADLVLKNAKVFNVFTGEFIAGDVAIQGGYIAGVGSYSGKEEINLQGRYLTPGFIDGHVHLESGLVSPAEFARLVVAAGTTTVVADPHEIANVVGADGIKFILDATEELPLSVYLMLPSCVPSSRLEQSGAELSALELAKFIGHPRVIGLGEVMDFPAVLRQEPGIMEKIALAEGMLVDGHAPGLSGRELTAYIAVGVGSDHECVTPEQAMERLRQGMYVMIREGSAAKNLLNLLPMVTLQTSHRCMFVTDDRHPEDLVNLGHINHLVRMAVAAGLDVELALQMASINAANYFRLNDVGAIAPGYRADLQVFSDLVEWRPDLVWKSGVLVAEAGTALFSKERTDESMVRETMHLARVEAGQLRLPAQSPIARVIGLIPGQLVTENLELPVKVVDGAFVAQPEKDIVKMAVWERHKGSGNVGVGLLRGLGLRRGAIASTVAHDSHNLVVAGVNDSDMLLAVSHIEKMQGGLVAVADGLVLGSLPLPLAGLMADREVEWVQEELAILQAVARDLGIRDDYDPFMTLAFLSLPVIPDLKLTDAGLVDVLAEEIVSVSVLKRRSEESNGA